MAQQTPTSGMIPGASYPPPGFPNMMSGGMMNGNFGYPQVPYYPQQQVQQQNGGRRGRVSYNKLTGIITDQHLEVAI
jgi:hypothetical protein